MEPEGFSAAAGTFTSGAEGSSVEVSLLQGRTDRRYAIKVRHEGEDTVIASRADVDFGVTPIVSVPLPLMRPGRYPLDVEVTDGVTACRLQTVLDEPLRYPVMHVGVWHDEVTGELALTVKDNPYGLWLRARTRAVVTGSCTVNLADG